MSKPSESFTDVESAAYYICIDGGGSKTKACLYSASGQLLFDVLAGPANIFSDFDAALTTLLLSCDNLLEQAKLAGLFGLVKSNIDVCAACAGAETQTAKSKFRAFLAKSNLNSQNRFRRFHLISDLEAACLGANAGQECVLLIVGTGSVLGHLQPDKNGNSYAIAQYGGHGLTLGDHASGADIGLRALKALLLGLDGLHSDSEFVSSLLSHLQIEHGPNTKTNIVIEWSNKSAGDYASLAPVIINMADKGSQIASDILNESTQYLSDILAANQLHDKPVFIAGGLAGVYRPRLTSSFNIQTPLHSAEYGAFLYAKMSLK